MAWKLVDSHCHLDFPELSGDVASEIAEMAAQGVVAALCVGVRLDAFSKIRELVDQHQQLFASVGVHPSEKSDVSGLVDTLVALGSSEKVIAIGETGLDYFRETDKEILDAQRGRFVDHILASIRLSKPLVIHTRAAQNDTLDILRAEAAGRTIGVMHCFTEDIDMARQCLDLGMFISFSGIITFRNAASLREVAAFVPEDRLLVETDSPYLAPSPHRGKTNRPAYVRHVAECLASVRGVSLERIAEATTGNFARLFPTASNVVAA